MFTALRRFFLIPAIVMTMVAAGCEKAGHVEATPPPPYEGQYKNSKGAIVLEIKDGKLTYTDPRTRSKVDTSFTPSGDKMIVETSTGNFTLTFQAPDTITGLPATIAGTSEPLKKAS